MLALVARSEAKRTGLKRYFTGKPCSRGHVALRDVVNATCVECTLDWKRQNPQRVKEYSNQYYVENREAELAKSKAYFKTEAGRAAMRRTRENNKEKRNAYSRRWRAENPDKAKTAVLNWLLENRDTARRMWRENSCRRWREDPQFKLKQSLRTRVNSVIKRRTKAGSAIRDLGCTLDDLVRHIEKQFVAGMCWENWGSVWQLDHIKALAGFDLSNREQFLAACHYTNLQPLLIEDHKKKTSSDRRSLALAA